MSVGAVSRFAVYAEEVSEGDCLYTVDGENVREVSGSREIEENREITVSTICCLGESGEGGSRSRTGNLRSNDIERKDYCGRSLRFMSYFSPLPWHSKHVLWCK